MLEVTRWAERNNLYGKAIDQHEGIDTATKTQMMTKILEIVEKIDHKWDVRQLVVHMRTVDEVINNGIPSGTGWNKTKSSRRHPLPLGNSGGDNQFAGVEATENTSRRRSRYDDDVWMKCFMERKIIDGCESRWFDVKRIFQDRGIYKSDEWLKDEDADSALKLRTTEKWAKADKQPKDYWNKKRQERKTTQRAARQ